MGEISSHCGDLVVGFCGAGVDSGGLDRLHLLSSSSLCISLVYAMMIMVMIIHTTGSPGEGREGGECKSGCRNLIMICTHILLT